MDCIGKILSLCKGIIWLASEVKANKKRCRRLSERVKAMEEIVQSIRQRGPRQISSNVNRALGMLTTTLTQAQELVHKCTKTRFPNLVKCKSEFDSVNENLRDIFQILSGALQVEQGNMMHQLFQDCAEDDNDNYGALMQHTGAMCPAYYSPPPVAPVSYFAAPARAAPPPVTAVYAAALETDGNAICYTEAFLFMQ